jgi:hypothetical protein
MGPGAAPMKQPYGSFAGKPPQGSRSFTQLFSVMGPAGSPMKQPYGSFLSRSGGSKVFSKVFSVMGPQGAPMKQLYGSYIGKLVTPPPPPLTRPNQGVVVVVDVAANFTYGTKPAVGAAFSLIVNVNTPLDPSQEYSLLFTAPNGQTQHSDDSFVFVGHTNMLLFEQVTQQQYLTYHAAAGEFTQSGIWQVIVLTVATGSQSSPYFFIVGNLILSAQTANLIGPPIGGGFPPPPIFSGFYVAENGADLYITEDGLSVYVPEGPVVPLEPYTPESGLDLYVTEDGVTTYTVES